MMFYNLIKQRIVSRYNVITRTQLVVGLRLEAAEVTQQDDATDGHQTGPVNL